MRIPKYPEVPRLFKSQISDITKVVFCEKDVRRNCDAVFVFGSSHPSTYLNAGELFEDKRVKEIIVTGGISKSQDKHKSWIYGDISEARLICNKLLDMKVPLSAIFMEENSSNSKENIIFAKDIYDFKKVKSLFFISKNYAAGRQYLTLKKYLPGVDIYPYSYEVRIDNEFIITKDNWTDNPKSLSLVFGEYLRIVYYGRIGDISSADSTVYGLNEYIENLFQTY